MSNHEAPPLATPLSPGSVTADHLDDLLAGTSISSKAAIQALHDHLVKGVLAPAAIEKANISKAYFYSRVKIIEKAHQHAAKLSQYYEISPEGIRVRPAAASRQEK